MKPKKAFEKCLMNYFMIVLIKLYGSSISEESETGNEESSITVVASRFILNMLCTVL